MQPDDTRREIHALDEPIFTVTRASCAAHQRLGLAICVNCVYRRRADENPDLPTISAGTRDFRNRPAFKHTGTLKRSRRTAAAFETRPPFARVFVS